MRVLHTENLKEGMRLAFNLKNNKGVMLIKNNIKLTNKNIECIKECNIHNVTIEDDLCKEIEVYEVIDSEYKEHIKKNMLMHEYEYVSQLAKRIANKVYYDNTHTSDVCVINIKQSDYYDIEHSIDVCIYSCILGKALGLSLNEIETLSQVAIFSYIGKSEIDDSILGKEDKLTTEEMEEIKRYPRESYNRVKNFTWLSSVIKQAILYQCEAFNEMGYYGVEDKKVSIYSRIVRICDVYDAMTSKRHYRKTVYSTSETIEYLLGNADTLFDREILKTFIETFPIYPVGYTVLLSNDTEAVIICSQHHALRPIVRILTGNSRGELVDLFDNTEYRDITIKKFI